MSWRDEVRPIIAAVIEEVGTDDMRKLRSELRRAFPFGPRGYHPYRIWCHEIRVQLGQVPKPGSRRPVLPCCGQRNLFGE